MTMDYKTLIHVVVDPFLHNPDALLIRETDSDDGKDVEILIVAENEDTARLIGKRGTTANAIRDIVAVAGKLEEKRVHIKFESFNEEEKKD
jgi:predicted RNA-binding protein YlqC (UPF0109 family)